MRSITVFNYICSDVRNLLVCSKVDTEPSSLALFTIGQRELATFISLYHLSHRLLPLPPLRSPRLFRMSPRAPESPGSPAQPQSQPPRVLPISQPRPQLQPSRVSHTSTSAPPLLPPPQPEPLQPLAPRQDPPSWSCSHCTYSNFHQLQQCEVCLNPKP